MDKNTDRIVDTRNAEHYTWGQTCEGWHFSKGENLSVIKEKMPAGTHEKLHYHQKSQQFFYILSGTATFEIDKKIFTAGPNQGIRIKPFERHKIINNTGDELEFIVVSTPPSHGDRTDLE